MAIYRNYIRPSAGFDGATAETPDNYTQTGFEWICIDASNPVGLFNPEILGRKGNPVSLIRVMLQGTINALNDFVSCIDTSNQTRYTRPASIVSSGWMYFGSQDTLRIFSPAATSAEILVQDLTDETLQAWILADISSGSSLVLLPQENITLLASAAIPVYEGQLIVHINNAADATFTLPDIAAFTNLGAEIVFIKSGAGTALIASADLVNDQNTTSLTQYRLEEEGDSMSFLLVEDGWQTDLESQNIQTYTVASTIESLAMDTVVNANFATDLDLTLPSTDPGTGYRLGQRIHIYSSGAGIARVIIQDPTDTVNSVAGVIITAVKLVRGESATFVASPGGWTCDKLPGAVNVSITGAGIVPSVNGTVICQCSTALNIAVVLPDITEVRIGSRILISKDNTVGVISISVDDPADTINGVAAAGGTVRRLSALSSSVEYVRCTGGWWCSVEQNPIAESSAAAIVAAARTGFYEMTGALGQTLTLPALSQVDTGTIIYVFNNSGNAHDFVPTGTDEINGANATWNDIAQDRTQIVSAGTAVGWLTFAG